MASTSALDVDRSAAVPDSLGATLRVAIMRTSRLVRLHGQTGVVTTGQYAVLVALQEGPATLRRLADHERVQPPWMTRTVDALEQLGLVSRSTDPADGRQVLVALSDAGRACIAETRQRRAQWLDERLSGLTPEQRAVLSDAAEILLDLTR